MSTIIIAALEVILEDYHAGRATAIEAMFRVWELVQHCKEH
jgi:hypothetical protein